MSRTTAQGRALAALEAYDDGSAVELDAKKAIDRNGATYVPFVQPFARNFGVEPGTKVIPYVVGDAEAMIFVPADA